MVRIKSALLVFLLAVACWALAPRPSEAQRGAVRQYYGSRWFHYPKQKYSLCYYYFKPHAGYSGYKYQYAIYQPSTPGYVYYYNPHKRKYWGRYDVERRIYSVLPADKRKASLSNIPATDFPRGGPMPPVPQSKDGVQLAAPPQTPA